MSNGFVFLDECGFVYERVLFIPNGYWSDLYEYEWKVIDSTIKGML